MIGGERSGLSTIVLGRWHALQGEVLGAVSVFLLGADVFAGLAAARRAFRNGSLQALCVAVIPLGQQHWKVGNRVSSPGQSRRAQIRVPISGGVRGLPVEFTHLSRGVSCYAADPTPKGRTTMNRLLVALGALAAGALLVPGDADAQRFGGGGRGFGGGGGSGAASGAGEQ